MFRGVGLSKYRDKLRIIADMLEIVSHRARKTQIMYQANLSYKLLSRYLNEVLAAELVYCDDEDCYILTSKGKEFLFRYEEYFKFRKSIEEQNNRANSEKGMLEKMIYSDDVVRLSSSKGGKERSNKTNG